MWDIKFLFERRYKVSKFNPHFLPRGEKHWKDLSKEEIDEVIEKELRIQEEKSTRVKLYFIKFRRIHLLSYVSIRLGSRV